MKLIRYKTSPMLDPVSSLAELREEMDRLFGYTFPSLRPAVEPLWQSACPVNLYRENDRYILRAEVPGFDKKNLQIEVVDGSLVLSGHASTGNKKDTAEESGETRFTRNIPLPDEVDVTQIKAEYQNGVLTVSLPKKAEVKPRQIAIEVK
jgi:HSP20 family protein